MSASRPVYIGRTSARMLDAAAPEVVGVLVKWTLAWALRDETPEDVPPALAPLWAVIEEESRTMHDLRDERAAAGRRGGLRSKPKQTEATPKQTEANRSNAEANGSKRNQKETETEKEIYTESNPKSRALACARVAGKPASVSDSDSVSVFTDLDSFDWFTRPNAELVPAALALVGESGNRLMRGRLGKARRLLGLPQFREVLATFAAELRAGEVPANPGATLNARLSAREACQ